ncbi:MAG TPA: alpha/beta hydrolase [Ktedonobacteraceae bacterium]|nr:alpha/beta hydrolase [Ktedonobacteraceae bacterium]
MPSKAASDAFVAANSVTLHTLQWDGQGQTLVCVHGVTANASSFQALADALSPQHRLIAYDIRGRGDSDKPQTGYSIPIYATDLAALIDALGLERPVIVGHSLGALIGLYFAAHYPDKLSKLVLIDAGAPLPWKGYDDQPAWLKASISRIGTPFPSFAAFIERMKAAPYLAPYWNEYMDLYFQHDVHTNADGSVVTKTYREAVIEDARHAYEGRPEDQWRSVQVPTLLLRAGQGLTSNNDQLLSEADAKAVQQGIRNIRYVNFPTLNHYTINFGVEPGPAQEILTFVDEQ